MSSSGSALDHVVYDSFGNIVTETNASNGDRFKFGDLQYDSQTKQYFAHARWYSGGIGRFMNPDPLGFAGGDPDVYAYVTNDAVNEIDPSGENPLVGGIIARWGRTAWWSDGSWQAITGGMVGGGISGALSGMGLAPVVSGAVGGFVSNSTTQLCYYFSEGKPISFSSMVGATVVGGGLSFLVGLPFGNFTGTMYTPAGTIAKTIAEEAHWRIENL